MSFPPNDIKETMMNFLITALIVASSLAVDDASDETIASIRLYNPTRFTDAALVEVPVGRIAAPGIVDWRKHRLLLHGKEVPYSIREGRAHWKARLSAPIESPRAEDLLVFWCAVPPNEWTEIQVVPRPPNCATAIGHEGATLTVAYPGIKAIVNEDSGMLTALTLAGEPVLDGPMTLIAWPLPIDSFQYTGNIGPGYVPFQVNVKHASSVPVTARLASSSSTLAMTELNFIIAVNGGPDVAVTYRIHQGGLVEIQVDERPWVGKSPWLNYALSYELPLRGASESIPLLENRQPFYGFKDFAGTIKQIARKHRGDEIEIVELGEETPNGRRWMRRLHAVPHDAAVSVDDLVEIMDEGLIVHPVPVAYGGLGTPFEIFDTEQTRPMSQMLSYALRNIGIRPETTEDPAREYSIRFELLNGQAESGIEGDGFEIREETGHRVRVTAKNLLGLHQAAANIATSLLQEKRLPLIARNPVVNVRGGGFGGGPFEVDFPYGDNAEWKRVFENLLDSGMNTFWCLGMWGNWKMPVAYEAMPELRSDAPNAYDESSGVLFKELDEHREHGLELMQFLQSRGGRVYVWLPIGCVPTTFMEHYPEAIAPGKVGEFWGRPKGTPCFTHPIYRKYLDAFLKELVETYPLDGVVLVRDDNGGVCDCERCTAFTAASTTKNAVWEQYLLIHQWLRAHDFDGAIGVYPYFDGYTPALDALMPDDLFIAGHGASTAVLTRNQEQIGHMPDTWLDSLFTNFKLPPSPRMRRLLGDRGSFWIGGAYQYTELPWEALGYFGWEPTATPNTFRYQWGAREFGKENALAFVRLNDIYEDLWEINARFMIPNVWIKLEETRRTQLTAKTLALLRNYDKRLVELKESAPGYNAVWFDHGALFSIFLEYHLHRLGLFMEMAALVDKHSATLDGPEGLPEAARTALLAKYQKMNGWAEKYSKALHAIPGNMLKATRNMTMPYDEWMSGWEGWLDPKLSRRQFTANVTVAAPELRAGESFSLIIEVHNAGIIPWADYRIGLSDNVSDLGLPTSSLQGGPVFAPGDRRAITLTGTAPATPGEAETTVTVFGPTRNHSKMGEAKITLVWK